jgi:hypothetical protein
MDEPLCSSARDELKPGVKTAGFDADGTERVIWILFPDELLTYVDGATAIMASRSAHTDPEREGGWYCGGSG